MKSYAAECHAPLAHWRKQAEGINHHAMPIHVRLDERGAAYWDGVEVTDAKLTAYLETSRKLNPNHF